MGHLIMRVIWDFWKKYIIELSKTTLSLTEIIAGILICLTKVPPETNKQTNT